MNNLPKVVTQRHLKQDSNSRPFDRKPKRLTRCTTAVTVRILSKCIVELECTWLSEMRCCAVQFVLLFSIIEGVHLTYDGYQYPAWAEGVGWLLAATVIAFIPLWAVLTVYRSLGSCEAMRWLVRSPGSVVALNLRDVITPADNWGPALACNQRRPHQSPRSFYWVYMIPRLLRLSARRSANRSDSCSTVSYHEGHCFVSETSFYSQSNDDSHLRY